MKLHCWLEVKSRFSRHKRCCISINTSYVIMHCVDCVEGKFTCFLPLFYRFLLSCTLLDQNIFHYTDCTTYVSHIMIWNRTTPNTVCVMALTMFWCCRHNACKVSRSLAVNTGNARKSTNLWRSLAKHMHWTERILKCTVLYSSSDFMWTTDSDCALSEKGTKWLFEQYDHCTVGGTLSCQ